MANFAFVIELERHITKLLLGNDCVIVPGFGGFMTHHVDAIYDEEDGLFYPPLRTLGFNSQLKMNDSMLVQSFVEVHDISYPEALSRIEGDVAELKSRLEEYGSYELNDLGTIRLTPDGRYEFVPCEAGILTPNFYGLSSYEIERLKSQSRPVAISVVTNGGLKQNDDARKQNETLVADEEDEKKVLTISFATLRNVAVACIVAALFVLFPSSIGDGNADGLLKSKIDTNLIFNMIPKDLTFGKPSVGSTVNAVAKPSVTRSKPQENSAATAEGEKEEMERPCFGIVVASKVSYKNAKAYVKRLHERGHGEAKVLDSGRYAKVIYNEYPTKEDANEALNKLNDDAEFADAWITKISR